MKRLTLRMAPLALLAVLLGTGCIIHEHDADADVTFFWDFEGYDCVSAGVSHTLVQIWEGPRLEAEEYIPCDASGVTLEDFYPGDYSYYIAGLSPSGRTLYENSAGIYLRSGENHYDVRLYFVGR